MQRSDRVYVAGHRGLVGSALHRGLTAGGYQKLIIRTSREVDLRRQRDVETFFQEEQPEYVFLAAAKVGGILANSTYKAEFIYDNLAIAANVIHSAYRSGVRKLLNLGSSCIYPKSAPQPLKEEYLLTGSLEATNEPYAVAKIAALKLCRYYNEQYGTDFISLMPTNLYGPADDFNLETAHVLPALLRKFHLARLLRQGDFQGITTDMQRIPLGFGLDQRMDLKDERSIAQVLEGLGIRKDSVVIWGSGAPYREFLFVDDLADACLFFMANHGHRDIGEFVNVGVGEDVTIRNLAILIRSVIGYDGDIHHDLAKPDGTPRKVLDLSRMKALGWEPRTSLREGIRMTYAWYLSSIPASRQ